MITITVNGKAEELQDGITLAGYIAQKEYRMELIATERNGEIVPKAQYGQTVLADGDTLEVVSFVGGG